MSAPLPAAEGPATAPATRPALKAVDFDLDLYLARLEIHTTITPAGKVRSVRTENKSYGPNDNPGPPRTEVREGNLSPMEIAELSRLFQDWEKLKDSYRGPADGPVIKISYGDKQIISGSADAPKNVLLVQERILEISRAFPVPGEKRPGPP